MMQSRTGFMVGILILMVLSGCQKEPVGNERRVNGIILNARYLASQNGTTADTSDKRTLTFLLSIRPEASGANLMQRGITTPQQFAERIQALSFHSEELITFRVGKNNFTPTVAQYENIHDPSGKINIILKWVVDKEDWNQLTQTSPTIELLFEDPYWKTGIHHFSFNQQELARSV